MTDNPTTLSEQALVLREGILDAAIPVALNILHVARVHNLHEASVEERVPGGDISWHLTVSVSLTEDAVVIEGHPCGLAGQDEVRMRDIDPEKMEEIQDLIGDSEALQFIYRVPISWLERLSV